MVTVQQWLFMGGMLFYLPTGSSQVLRGPPTMTGFLGKSLSVICQYNESYQWYKKYWCKGADLRSCNIVLRTDGSEREVKTGRTAIRDYHIYGKFVVTLKNLTKSDSDSYWCAIEKSGADYGFHIDITVLPVPDEVSAAVFSSYTPSEATTSPSCPPSRNTISVLFLILIGLKAAGFLSLISAIIWMQKKKKMTLLMKSHENH